MIMKRSILKSLVLSLLLFSFLGINAQDIDLLYQDNTISIYGQDSSRSCYEIVKNLDSDDRIWISVYSDSNYNSIFPKKTLIYNSQSRVFDSIFSLNFHYKFNNKLYFVDNKFICFDLNDINTPMIESNIYDFVEQGVYPKYQSQNVFTKEREFFVFYYSEILDKTLIYVVDTLGNTLRSDTIDKFIRSCDLIDHGNYIVLSNNLSGSFNFDYQLYLIDKLSLQMTDSIEIVDLFNGGDIISLNDSILIFENYQKIEKINTNTKHSNVIINNIFNTPLMDNFLMGIRERRIDYRNPDSIYLCSIKEHSNDSITYIHVINFSSSGVLNYNYPLSFDANHYLKTIGGIQVMNNGDLCFAVNSRREYGHQNYFVVFNPDELGIESVERYNKETIIIYPNPTKDLINIVSSDEVKEVTIYNSLSQRVYSRKLKGKDIEINVSNFSKGSYIVDIKTDKGNIRKKFIVE